MFDLQTADTSQYMVAGYVIAFAVMFLYVASLYIRYRNLNRDLSLFEDMEQDNK